MIFNAEEIAKTLEELRDKIGRLDMSSDTYLFLTILIVYFREQPPKITWEEFDELFDFDIEPRSEHDCDVNIKLKEPMHCVIRELGVRERLYNKETMVSIPADMKNMLLGMCYDHFIKRVEELKTSIRGKGVSHDHSRTWDKLTVGNDPFKWEEAK